MNDNKNLTITIDGVDYKLATNLRVAYMIQGQNDHAPYATVFAKIPELPIEKQVAVLYAAFACANKKKAEELTQTAFVDYCLDTMNLADLMDKLGAVAEGIMGPVDTEENTAPAGDAKNV